MTAFIVGSGQTLSGVTLNGGDTEYVLSGGTASATTVDSGGFQVVSAGGTASGTTINSGGLQDDSGVTIGTSLTNAFQVVEFGGIASDTTITSGGVQTVFSGGTASGTTIISGGRQYDFGVAIGTALTNAFQVVESGGTASGTTISGASVQAVSSGGTASGTTISGGVQAVFSGGTASGTTIISGGWQDDFGVAIGTALTDARQLVEFGGTASGTTISGGGAQLVLSGGTAIGTTIDSGGEEFVLSGGTAIGVTFDGPSGTLDIAQPQALSGSIAGFQIGDTIDLVNTAATSLSYSGTAANGTLSVMNAAVTIATFAFSGAYGSGQFLLSPDGHGGTDITLIPIDATIPAETVGGPYSGNENTSIALSGLSVSASPNTGDTLTTVLSVANGTITVGTTGGATVSSNGTASVTLSGTAAQIDMALGTASYQGSQNYYGPDTLNLTTTDLFNQNQALATGQISIADAAVLTNTVPGSLSGVWGTAISLSGISVADNPNTNDALTTVLSVSNGTISIGTPGTATIAGNDTRSVTLGGTQAAIDAALATAGYLASLSFDGTDTLSVVTTDPAGISSGTSTVAITPNRVGDPDPGLLLGAGPAGADNWTNANHPMFAGAALPGSSVVLYDGTTTIGSGQTNAQGVWTITANTLPLGTKMITAVATDPQGHQTTSPGSSILVIPGTSFQTAGNENANFQAGGQNNTFQFGNGTVVVITGNGSNQVTGGDGGDTVRLGDGPNNWVSLGNGNDSVQSGNGKNNTVTLGNGNDTVTLGNGNDTVTLGNGNDTVTLGNGNDTLTLGNGTDTATLGNGNDTINLGGGNYTVAAGTGSNLLVFAAPQALLTMAFSAKDELVFRNSGFDLAVDNGKGTMKPQAIDASLFGTFPSVGGSGDRFAYNQGTGNLYYSPNGSVASETLVAHLTNVPHLTAGSLFFIS